MVRKLLRQVDTAKILAASAVLQMDPGNVNELYILDRLSYFAATTVSESVRDPSSSAIRRLLAADEVGGPSQRAQLDPFEGFPVGEVLFPPRRLMIVEGQATGSATVASRLLRAVLTQSGEGLPESYARSVDRAGKFLLGLSDLLCERFERSTDERPGPRTSRPSVPSAARLAELREHVIFSQEELFGRGAADDSNPFVRRFVWVHGDAARGANNEGEGRSGQDSGAMEELSYPFGPGRGDGDEYDDTALATRPIVKTHLGYVIASPGSLAAAFRHYVVTEAQRQDCVPALAAALAADSMNEAMFLFESLADGSLQRVEPQDPEREYNAVEEVTREGQLIRLTADYDGDKRLDICLGVDSLEDYDPASIWGRSSIPSFEVPVLNHDPSRVLRINTFVGVGRDFMYLDNPGESPKLFGSLEDFESLLFAPGGRKLTLWYFAQAWNKLATQAQVMSFSIVDAFSTFRDHQDSFYLSDGRPPNAVYFEPATGQELRALAAASRGPAFERYGQGFARALALHGDASPVSMLMGVAAVCFIRLPYMTVWARCRLDDGGDPPNMHPQSFPAHHLAEAIAYWLWQIYEAEAGLVMGSDGPPDLLVEAEAFWAALVEDGSVPMASAEVVEPAGGRSSVVEGLDTRQLAVRVGLPSGPFSPDPENELDRVLVRCLLSALFQEGGKRSEPPAAAVEAFVNRIAPPGYKTMLQVSSEDDDPILWPGSLPASNRISDAAVAIVLDDLGARLKAQGMRPGPIPDDQRQNVLNTKVMRYLLDEFTDLVKTLDGHAAIRYFLLQYEATLHEVAADQRRLPYTIACFGTGSARVEELRKRTQSETTTSIALRFLIEYLSALPPTGDAVLTIEACDRLLALAAEAVNKGQLSDSLNLGLSDHQLSILESGRFGIARDVAVYSMAVDRFQGDRAQKRIEEATGLALTVGRADEDDLSEGDFGAEEIVELDRLAEAEYGFSYTALANACGALIDASRALDQEDLGQLSPEDAERAIVERVECSEEVAGMIVAALTLREHPRFWESGIDVYPWTFNRARSYLRQPLVEWAAEDGSHQLLFGHRNVFLASRNWLDRHLTGRLQATSNEMKSAMSAERDREGLRFEGAVDAAARAAGATCTQRRFKRAGPMDLSNVNGVDLGDVDVLVVTAGATLIAIEAKSLQVARTPRELANEMKRLVDGPKAAVVRIQERVEVLRRHVPAIEAALDLPTSRGRPVVPLVVTDEPLIGSFMNSSQIEIVAIADLADTFDRIDRVNRRRR